MNIWFITQTAFRNKVWPMRMWCHARVQFFGELNAFVTVRTQRLYPKDCTYCVSMVTGNIRGNTKAIRGSSIIMTQGKSAPNAPATTHLQLQRAQERIKEKVQRMNVRYMLKLSSVTCLTLCWTNYTMHRMLKWQKQKHLKNISLKSPWLYILFFAIYRDKRSHWLIRKKK